MKYSKQKELILKTVKENHIHPSTEKIYELVKYNIPNISLGTVYRNLNKFAQKGSIKKIEGINGSSIFDGNTEKHHHFICEQCNSVIDIDEKDIPIEMGNISNKEFTIHSYDLTLKGICSKCYQQ